MKIIAIKTSNESHVYWKKYLRKNSLYFGIFSEFDAVNEIDTSSVVIKTTIIFKQNTLCNGYFIISELNDDLESDCYESALGYDNDDVDWFCG